MTLYNHISKFGSNFNSIRKHEDFIVIDLNATEIISQKNKISSSIKETLFNLMTLGDDRLIDEVYIMGQRTYKK